MMDQILADAKFLAQRLQHHDGAADALIGDASNLETKLQAMKEYREEVTKLNDIAKHRPRSTLILGSQLENQRIRDLENENRELHLALADHQSTLELIMNKYREQVLNLLTNKGLDKAAIENMNKNSGDINVLKEKVTEMAAVMHRAVQADEEVEQNDVEMLTKLKYENKTLRDLLSISGQPKKEIERLKFKEKVQRENLSMNGDILSSENEDQTIDSSGEEVENQTGTVKRRFKGQSSNSLNDINAASACNGSEQSASKQASVIEMKIQNEEMRSKEDGWSQVSDFRGHMSEVRGHVSAIRGDTTPVKGSSGFFEEMVVPVDISESEKDNSSHFDDIADQEVLPCSERDEQSLKSVPKRDTNNVEVLTSTVLREGDARAVTALENISARNVEINDVGSRRKEQEEILELYNSEGILMEDPEETQNRKTSDGKMSGIKIRRSTKQKKVIQADLKSFFENESEENKEGKRHVDDLRRDTEELKSEREKEVEQSRAVVCGAEAIVFNAEAIVCNAEVVTESKGASSSDEEVPTLNASLDESKGKENKESLNETFSPPESPIDSPDYSEKQHRIVQLDYSDSDSDDPEMMVEDQFADIIYGESGSDSSSEGSGLDPDFEEEEATEEELVGDLNEGGEYAMSRWARPAEECKHLDDNPRNWNIDKPVSTEMGLTSSEATPSDGVSSPMQRQGDNGFAFTEAFMQVDQFTGGSIEAKYAKRKKFKHGSKASAVTLLAQDHPGLSENRRSNIRSDSELTTANESVLDAVSSKSTSLSITVSSKATKTADDTSPSDSFTNLNTHSNSSLEDSSSSGEIDPTVFKQRLATAPQEGEVNSKAAANLTDLLSDLDAALELEDSD